MNKKGIWGIGIKCPFFLSSAAGGGRRQEKENSRGHPLNPAKGPQPLGTPLKPMGLLPTYLVTSESPNKQPDYEYQHH
jgi:hypothetical protein